LLSETKASGVRAVIAPNMAKQIVALQVQRTKQPQREREEKR
jgi:hypothetical protein